MNESKLVPREENSDLDWLARNVHEWQSKCLGKVTNQGVKFTPYQEGEDEFTCDWSYKYGLFTESQWLDRRSELQNKPIWNDAPEWAEWLAQDEDGAWWYFSAMPKCQSRSFGICADFAGAGEVLGDWRDTLEKRPETSENPAYSNQPKPSADTPECEEVKQFEPFVSVEDAQQELSELEMLANVSHLISDKRHRITPSKYTKEIRGVSVDVYDVLQAWGVSNPALQHLIKKALQCGQRGHKDNAQDLQDIIDSAIRAKELES